MYIPLLTPGPILFILGGLFFVVAFFLLLIGGFYTQSNISYQSFQGIDTTEMRKQQKRDTFLCLLYMLGSFFVAGLGLLLMRP